VLDGERALTEDLYEGKVYVDWEGLNVDMMQPADRQALIQAMNQCYPDEKQRVLINWSAKRGHSGGR
jgi:hypothetical protein